MTAPDEVAGCATYSRSPQWRQLMELLARVEQRGHIHLFVNTSLHPHSLERLVKGVLELQDARSAAATRSSRRARAAARCTASTRAARRIST